jgi:hypothetical protein
VSEIRTDLLADTVTNTFADNLANSVVCEFL